MSSDENARELDDASKTLEAAKSRPGVCMAEAPSVRSKSSHREPLNRVPLKCKKSESFDNLKPNSLWEHGHFDQSRGFCLWETLRYHSSDIFHLLLEVAKVRVKFATADVESACRIG
jgi:hypothetical protein